MKTISKSQILALTLSLGIFLALGSARAFTPPNVGQPTGSDWQNIAEPFDESANFQMKDGGLSVNTFSAIGLAAFIQDLNLNGLVNGGTETDTTSSIAFGDGSSTVNIRAIGSLRSNVSFTSESLAHSDSGLRPICADSLGHLFLCPVAPPSGPTGPICGNGILQSGEQCDDGNTTSGDGCSATCQNEAPISTLSYINVTATPVQGGTGDTNVVCSASLSSGGASADVNIRYSYVFSSSPGIEYASWCQLQTDASGVGTDYPGHEYWGQDVVIKSYCLDSANVPVDPSITRC